MERSGSLPTNSSRRSVGREVGPLEPDDALGAEPARRARASRQQATVGGRGSRRNGGTQAPRRARAGRGPVPTRIGVLSSVWGAVGRGTPGPARLRPSRPAGPAVRRTGPPPRTRRTTRSRPPDASTKDDSTRDVARSISTRPSGATSRGRTRAGGGQQRSHAALEATRRAAYAPPVVAVNHTRHRGATRRCRRCRASTGPASGAGRRGPVTTTTPRSSSWTG